MFFIFELIRTLVILGIIVGLIALAMRKRKNKLVGFDMRGKKDSYFNLFFSEEDFFSQMFFVLGVLFFGVTISMINRNLGDLLSWQTITLITTVASFGITYYFKKLYTLILGSAGLVIWWIAQGVKWVEDKDDFVRPMVVVAGVWFIFLLFYIAGRIHEKNIRYKRFSLLYLVFGILGITGFLFFFSTKIGLESLENLIDGEALITSFEFTLALTTLLILNILGIIYSAKEKLISMAEVASLIFINIFLVLLVFLPEKEIFIGSGWIRGDLTMAGVFWAVLFNVFIFLELLGIIFLGYFRKEPWMVNLGAFFLFFLIVVKYFDWFFGFFDKSFFFITAGVLLFVLGRFMEGGRRRMLEEMKKE